MKSSLNLKSSNLSGLFELDKYGTIYYLRLRRHNQLINSQPHLVGQNFFEQVAGLLNVADFKNHFRKFIDSRQTTDKFKFDCRFENEIVPVRIMLVRTRCADRDAPADLVFVDIRENTFED